VLVVEPDFKFYDLTLLEIISVETWQGIFKKFLAIAAKKAFLLDDVTHSYDQNQKAIAAFFY
jgi:hypothetical protein